MDMSEEDGTVFEKPCQLTNRKSLKERMIKLGETTTIHGIPRIAAAVTLHRKLLWICLVLGCYVLMMFQLYELFIVFNNNLIKTTVKLRYQAKMRLPAITLCNMNPIRKSRVTNIISNTLMDLVHHNQDDADAAESYPGSILKKLGKNDNITEEWWHDHNKQNDFSDPDSVVFKDDFDIYDHYVLDTNEYVANLKHMAKSNVEKWQKLKQQIIFEFTQLPWIEREEIGHQFKDFVVDCDVGGKPCLGEPDKLFTNNYGNCFIIKSKSYRVMSSGPQHGISLTLNLENFEFIEGYRMGYGVRMVIHDPGTVPMPDEEGVTLSAGYETSLAITKLKFERLGHPYGKCQNAMDFMKKYRLKYTRQVCKMICERENTLKKCNCDSAEFFMPILWDKIEGLREAPYCFANKQSYTCSLEMRKVSSLGDLNCECNNPCRETIYQTTFSGCLWPTEHFLKTLKTEVCNAVYMNDSCDDSTECSICPLDEMSNRALSMNFAKVQIYYKDLNFETVIEEPLYETTRFISDIGGILGLFTGVSVLSICELFDVIFELVAWFKSRKNKKSNREDIV